MMDCFCQRCCPVAADLVRFAETCLFTEMMDCKILTIRHETESAIAVFKPPIDDILV